MADLPAQTVRDWAETRAALEAARSQGRAVFLCSPPGAAAWLGAGWWAALQEKAHAEFPEVEFVLALDCGEDAGDAMAAIRAGVKALIFTGDNDAARKLGDMAMQTGSRLYRRQP